MAVDRGTVMRGRDRAPGIPSVMRPDWILAIGLFIAAIIASGMLFVETWRILLGTWINIGTYNYGLIVPFISLYLVLRMRKQLVRLTPKPSLWGPLAIVIISLLWAIGNLSGVLVIQQFAVLALIPSTGLAIFGKSVMRSAAFPALFVILALPAGEILIPQLIVWTADFSVVALEFLGIPVFRDGPFIRIPAGDFHVVKACSGIRYLLTAIVLGALFAYLSFKSWQRRAAFLLVCVLVPILANWLRATGIILIGHLSGMKLAGGVDHFIYGWIFFGFVMLIIFLIGARFSDRSFKDPGALPSHESATQEKPIRPIVFVAAFIGVLVAAPVGTVLSSTLSDRAVRNTISLQSVALPSAIAGWERLDSLTTDWNTVFVGARLNRSVEYRDGDMRVMVTAIYYDVQTEGAELIGSQNSLYEPVRWWSRFDSKATYASEENLAGLNIRESSVSDGNRDRLIWSWYYISGDEFASEYRAKLAMFKTLIRGDGQGVYLLALAVDYDHDVADARRSMGLFLDDYLNRFRQCLAEPANDVGSTCD